MRAGLAFVAVLLVLGAGIAEARSRHSLKKLYKELNKETDVYRKDRCTAIAVGPKAMVDGSIITTHTNDCHDCDFRIGLVKGGIHPEGSKLAIPASRFQYPKYVGYDRDPAYTPERITDKQYPWGLTPINGHIEQARHTFSYVDGSYPFINEKQLGIGESTCSARLVNIPVHAGGSAVFDIGELARVALSRTSTAREAIQLMGDLAVKYGYYGAEWEGHGRFGEAGESLTVADTKEVWIFHILPDGTDKSAVWVAQRVPDDHVAVVANEFIIGEVDLDNKEFFMASDNLFEVAVKNKFWDESKGPFNFRKAYSEPSFHTNRFYGDRRNWRVQSLVAPSLNLPSNSSLDDLAFSVKPDRLVTLHDVFAMMRDHYQGTEFDLTKGLAAGPFGNPNRYDPGWASGVDTRLLGEGAFERSISIHRTNYGLVTQSRANKPDMVGGIAWLALSQPHASCFIPFFPSVTRIAPEFQEGSLWRFRRESAWWAFNAVGNLMEKAYSHMLVDVKASQAEHETRILEKLALLENDISQLLSGGQFEQARAKLTEWSVSTSQNVVESWWKLLEWLFTRFNNGARIDDWNQNVFAPTALFYPYYWLKNVGFWPPNLDLEKLAPSHTRRVIEGALDTTPILPEHVKPAFVQSHSESRIVPVQQFEAGEQPAVAPAAPAASSGVSGLGLFALVAVVYGAGVLTGKIWSKKNEYEPLSNETF